MCQEVLNLPENVYEIIQYDTTNFKFTVGKAHYVMPHSHRELELGLVLSGRPRFITAGADCLLPPDSLWVTNPFQCHELRTRSIRAPYCYVDLQLPLSFFHQYYPRAEHVRFDRTDLTDGSIGEEAARALRRLLLETARSYFAQEAGYELICAAGINRLMALLLATAPHAVLSEQELQQANTRQARIQRLTDYIDAHMGEKLLLSDLAEREGLTLSYLSHIFREEMGMSFQSYLQGLRCRRAVALLIGTDQSLSDISMACGFSDLKYMNRGFQQIFGCTPAELRASGIREERQEEAAHGLTRPDRQTGYPVFTRLESLRRVEEALAAGEAAG